MPWIVMWVSELFCCLLSAVRKAYYKLSLKVHPDRAPANELELYTRKFQALGKIYEVLSDDDRRAVYDEDGEQWHGKLKLEKMLAQCRHTVASSDIYPFKVQIGRPVTSAMRNIHTDFFFFYFRQNQILFIAAHFPRQVCLSVICHICTPCLKLSMDIDVPFCIVASSNTLLDEGPSLPKNRIITENGGWTIPWTFYTCQDRHLVSINLWQQFQRFELPGWNIVVEKKTEVCTWLCRNCRWWSLRRQRRTRLVRILALVIRTTSGTGHSRFWKNVQR